STLQQESARKLRFSVKRTMMLAQRLYEGVEIGKEGAIGLITYMRTDSTRVSDDAISDVRHYIAERFGKEFLPDSTNIYKSKNDEEDEELKHRMPLVTEGEHLRFKAIRPDQHFTEPPPRYNEATLVKRLEADGVGRPSTYASILSTIQEREYVKKDGGRFVPTELGMVVTDLLLENFDDIFDVKY